MRPVLRLAWLDAVRHAVSWRTPLLVVILFPAIWSVMARPDWFPDPEGPLVVSRVFIGDAVPYLWANDTSLLLLFVLPAILITGSLVGDDRAAGGPLTSATRVGGPRGWWWAKALTIALLAAGFVALFAVLLAIAATLRGWEWRTGISPWVDVETGQRILAPLPHRGTLGSTPLLLALGWLQLVSVLLIAAVAGVLTRNRIVALAVPVALLLASAFLRINDVAKLWNSPIVQIPATQHDRSQVPPEAYVPWSSSIAVTCGWIAGLLLLGWFAARRVEL